MSDLEDRLRAVASRGAIDSQTHVFSLTIAEVRELVSLYDVAERYMPTSTITEALGPSPRKRNDEN